MSTVSTKFKNVWEKAKKTASPAKGGSPGQYRRIQAEAINTASPAKGGTPGQYRRIQAEAINTARGFRQRL